MTDRFNTLMDIFHTRGNLRYAAFCCLAVARFARPHSPTQHTSARIAAHPQPLLCASHGPPDRRHSCEKALKDVNGEAAAFTNSGHEFYLAEIERSAANEPSFEEYVGEATQCYLTAIALYLRPAPAAASAGAVASPASQSTVPPSVAFNAPGAAWTATAGSLYHELATLLQRLGRCGEACTYFLKAAEIHQGLDQFRTTLASLWAAVDASITQCLLLPARHAGTRACTPHPCCAGGRFWTGDYITTCVTLNWIVKIACEMPDITGLPAHQHAPAPPFFPLSFFSPEGPPRVLPQTHSRRPCLALLSGRWSAP